MTGAELRRALRLVVILDHEAARGRDLGALAAAAAGGGASLLQVRAKTLPPAALAQAVRAVLPAGVPVLVNDRLDVALASGAAGCHLGQDDLPIVAARAIVPDGFVLGASAGDAGELRLALAAGCDYVGIGPVHRTTTKADAGAAIGVAGFRALCEAARAVPCVAIGGIAAGDVAALLKAGAAGIAVAGAVLGAPDAAAAVRALSHLLPQAES